MSAQFPAGPDRHLRPLPPAVVVLAVLVLVTQAVATAYGDLRTPIFGASLLILDALGAVYSLRAARRGNDRTTWRLVATGRAASVLSTISFGVVAATGTRAWWWVAAVAGVTMFLSLAATALSVPARRLSRRQRAALFTEVATVLGGGFMLVWYFVLSPTVHRDGVEWAVGVAFPIGNLLLLGAVSAVLLRGAVHRLAQPMTVLLGGLLLYAIADVAFSSVGVHGQEATRSAPASASLVLSALVMTAAAMWAAAAAGPDADVRPAREHAPLWSTYLPYLAIIAGNALMLVVTIRENQFFLWGGLVIGQTVMTGAVVGRQIISLRESRHLNVTDTLTGLANLAGLQTGMQRVLRRRQQTAMLLLDLDGFKRINDQYGHNTGDAVLAEFAHAVRSAIRAEDIAARVGGDEFVVVLNDIAEPAEAVGVAQRILATIAATPVRTGGESLTIHASIGVTVAGPDDALKDIRHRADVAMYQAKRAGNHSWQLYDPSMPDRRARDGALADDLLGALSTRQLHVLYQPMVDLANSRPIAVEALLRWHHPKLGTISPLEFIPIAERTGVINQIGLWVLEQTCAQVRTWQRQVPDGESLHASVNVSPRQLQEPTLVDDVLAVLERTGLPASDLVLEITESAVVDEQVAIPALKALRAHGIRIAIDDFGTGYSSLHYLTRLPVDILKIDRSFVAELNGTPEGAAVTEAVIRLAQVLHLTIVAEGVETPEQATELQLLGCDTGQGYMFAKPLPANALDAMIVAGARQAV